MLVDHDGAAQNITDPETVGPYLHLCPAVAGKQGRKVAGVVRMRTVLAIKMRERGGKSVPKAAIALMDMESKNIAGAVVILGGQSVDAGGNDNTIVHGIKGNGPGYAGKILAAMDTRDSHGTGAMRMKHVLITSHI